LREKCAMDWKPATIESVKQIVLDDLASCNDKQIAAFEAYRVEPYLAPIVRYGAVEYVAVVAHNGFSSRTVIRMI